MPGLWMLNEPSTSKRTLPGSPFQSTVTSNRLSTSVPCRNTPGNCRFTLVMTGLGDGVGVGEAVGVAVGKGVGEGGTDGDGVALGLAVGVGVGVGVEFALIDQEGLEFAPASVRGVIPVPSALATKICSLDVFGSAFGLYPPKTMCVPSGEKLNGANEQRYSGGTMTTGFEPSALIRSIEGRLVW